MTRLIIINGLTTEPLHSSNAQLQQPKVLYSVSVVQTSTLSNTNIKLGIRMKSYSLITLLFSRLFRVHGTDISERNQVSRNVDYDVKDGFQFYFE